MELSSYFNNASDAESKEYYKQYKEFQKTGVISTDCKLREIADTISKTFMVHGQFRLRLICQRLLQTGGLTCSFSTIENIRKRCGISVPFFVSYQ